MKYPIFNYREMIGVASNAKQAEKLIRRCVDVPKGSKLEVWMRKEHVADILGLPVGWVYSISFGK